MSNQKSAGGGNTYMNKKRALWNFRTNLMGKRNLSKNELSGIFLNKFEFKNNPSPSKCRVIISQDNFVKCVLLEKKLLEFSPNSIRNREHEAQMAQIPVLFKENYNKNGESYDFYDAKYKGYLGTGNNSFIIFIPGFGGSFERFDLDELCVINNATFDSLFEGVQYLETQIFIKNLNKLQIKEFRLMIANNISKYLISLKNRTPAKSAGGGGNTHVGTNLFKQNEENEVPAKAAGGGENTHVFGKKGGTNLFNQNEENKVREQQLLNQKKTVAELFTILDDALLKNEINEEFLKQRMDGKFQLNDEKILKQISSLTKLSNLNAHSKISIIQFNELLNIFKRNNRNQLELARMVNNGIGKKVGIMTENRGQNTLSFEGVKLKRAFNSPGGESVQNTPSSQGGIGKNNRFNANRNQLRNTYITESTTQSRNFENQEKEAIAKIGLFFLENFPSLKSSNIEKYSTKLYELDVTSISRISKIKPTMISDVLRKLGISKEFLDEIISAAKKKL